MLKKEFKNQYKINNENISGEGIVQSYIELINKGYNMSIEEICNYLGCSNAYFLNNLKDCSSFISVNTVARDLAFHYDRKEIIDIKDYKQYFLKRLLYNREDFYKFILENTFVEHKFKRLTLDDFNIDLLDTHKEREIVKQLNYLSFKTYEYPEKGITEPITYIPKKLYSLKEIKQTFNFRYDVDFYRHIKKYGINKIQFFNFIRYDINEFQNKDVILVNYRVFKDLGLEKIKKELLKRLEINI